jgi:hypothetical protein
VLAHFYFEQAAQGWSITLRWGDILNIALGLLAIIQFVRNRRTKEVCKDILKRQAIQTAAHGFAEMARTAYDLETWISKGDWERSLDLAKRMMVSLAEGSGAWRVILEVTDGDTLDAARSEIGSVEKFVSVAAQNAPSGAQSEEMKQRCINAAIYLAEIAGRLKRPTELNKGLEEPKKLAKKSTEGE